LQASDELINQSIQRDLKFVNISNDQTSLLEWKSPGSFKNYLLDMKVIRENKINDFPFHINKLGMKIVYIRKNGIIFISGADDNVQYQLLEALLEEIIKRFYEKDDLVSKTNIKNITSDVFKSFKHDIEDIVYKFVDLDLVRIVDVPCKICKKTFPLIVKKNIIENSKNFPVYVVSIHNGHPIVCYVDKEFRVRGTGNVNFTGLIVS
jgi:hypothetical protein